MSNNSMPEHEPDEVVEGQCGAPIWVGATYTGFCCEPAFGKPLRSDGGHAAGLACPKHGGPLRRRSSMLERVRAEVDPTDALEVGESVREKGGAPAGSACDACGGTGTPVSGRKCMCGGTGLAADAVCYLRERLSEAMALLRELRAELDYWGYTDQVDRIDRLLGGE